MHARPGVDRPLAQQRQVPCPRSQTLPISRGLRQLSGLQLRHRRQRNTYAKHSLPVATAGQQSSSQQQSQLQSKREGPSTDLGVIWSRLWKVVSTSSSTACSGAVFPSVITHADNAYTVRSGGSPATTSVFTLELRYLHHSNSKAQHRRCGTRAEVCCALVPCCP